MTQKILKTLNAEKTDGLSIWVMRQAGRYLPEYRAIRKKIDNFMQLCFTPELASEITLQPIKRFDFDAAIVFSDILVIPHALGFKVAFEVGIGPILKPITKFEIEHLVKNFQKDQFLETLSPVFKVVESVRKQLSLEKSLIGFCGAPWTVATYMINGGSSKDHKKTKLFALDYPNHMKMLIDMLVDISADYLIEQIKHGADVVQIFDSWSGILDEELFERYCLTPVRSMVQKIKKIYPRTPIIGFPKQCGFFYESYCEKTGVTAVGLDWTVPLQVAKKIQNKHPIQGNLDPLRLIAGGDALTRGVTRILETLGNKPFIFNLGHGILPETPISNVEKMVDLVKSFRL